MSRARLQTSPTFNCTRERYNFGRVGKLRCRGYLSIDENIARGPGRGYLSIDENIARGPGRGYLSIGENIARGPGRGYLSVGDNVRKRGACERLDLV